MESHSDALQGNAAGKPDRGPWRTVAIIAGSIIGGWVLLAGLVLLALGLFWPDPSPGDLWGNPEPQNFFEHREDFDAAVEWVYESGTQSEYALDLAEQYQYLTTYGFVSVTGTTVFFPQWMGIPDDAGGYVYAPDGHPDRIDLYGSGCQNLTHLDGDWWSCSMNDEWLRGMGVDS